MAKIEPCFLYNYILLLRYRLFLNQGLVIKRRFMQLPNVMAEEKCYSKRGKKYAF